MQKKIHQQLDNRLTRTATPVSSHRSHQRGTTLVLVIVNLMALIIGYVFANNATKAYQLLQSLNHSELYPANQLPKVGTLVRLEGKAEALQALEGGKSEHGLTTLSSPFGETACLWFSFTAEEYHTVRKSNSSSSNSSYRDTYRDEWDVIASGSKRINFRLVDESGEAIIYPEGADIIADVSFSREVNKQDPLYSHPLLPTTPLSRSLDRRRFKEETLTSGTSVTIMGTVGVDRKGGKVITHAQKSSGAFSISNQSYQDTISHYKSEAWFNTLLGGGLMIFLSIFFITFKTNSRWLNVAAINVIYWFLIGVRFMMV